MSNIGGDILEINYANDNVGSGTLEVKSGETETFDPGGYRNEMSSTGSGKGIRKMNAVNWKVETTVVWDMTDQNTEEVLVALSEDLGDTTWTVAHVNGSTYSGVGVITGDIAGDMNEATIPLTLMGGGKMSKQG